MMEYNELANTDDGSCNTILVVWICMDPIAFNYNPFAEMDDNSCVMPLFG